MYFINTCEIHAEYINSCHKYMENTCLGLKKIYVFVMYAPKNKVLNLKYMRNTYKIHAEYMFIINT